MYRIKRKTYIRQHPLWLLQMLESISPANYEETFSLSEAQENLNRIYNTITGVTCSFHRNMRKISDIAKIGINDDTIILSSKRKENPILTFKILEEKSTKTSNQII